MRVITGNTPLPEGESKDGGAVRPILFSGPMVRALLAGTKTQTRRVLKPQPHFHNVWQCEDTLDWWQSGHGEAGDDPIHIRIKRGDRLWVREAHYKTDDGDYERAVCAVDDAEVREHLAEIERLKVSHPQVDWSRHARLRPGIHMPRWASRLTLTVTDIRVQRLQDISEEDAIAEGAEPCSNGVWFDGKPQFAGSDARGAYYCLWEHINGTGSWAASPWVVAYTFTVDCQNIDAALSLAQGDRT